MKRKLSSNIFLYLCISLLVACGGGSSGGDDPECLSLSYNPACVDLDSLDLPTNYTLPPLDTDTTKILSGRFVDAAVEGLRFETPTQSGLTDGNGIFQYIAGETVSFFIGDILLGTSTGLTKLTPLNLVPESDLNDPQVVNILRFVQSLDEDQNLDNGIRISNAVTTRALGQALDFSLSTTDFEEAANELLALLTSGSVNMLVDTNSAQAHFLASSNVSHNVMIAGDPFCDDWGGTSDFGCRIVPQGAPPNIGLTIDNSSASISIEILNQQYIELIDKDGDRETMAVAVFVTNSGANSASVSMKIGFTDENGSLIGYAIANTFPFAPGFSGLVAFTAHPNFQNASPIIYHGMLLNVDVAGGPITFGEFSQANIFPVDPTSSVGS